jgi:hypothetical protein
MLLLCGVVVGVCFLQWQILVTKDICFMISSHHHLYCFFMLCKWFCLSMSILTMMLYVVCEKIVVGLNDMMITRESQFHVLRSY